MGKRKSFLALFIVFLGTGGLSMKADAEESVILNQKQLAYLKGIEEATFRGFKKLLDPVTNLPVDIASIAEGDVSVHRKMPTTAKPHLRILASDLFI